MLTGQTQKERKKDMAEGRTVYSKAAITKKLYINCFLDIPQNVPSAHLLSIFSNYMFKLQVVLYQVLVPLKIVA